MIQPKWYLYLLISVTLLSSGCSQYFHQPVRASQARIGSETPGFKALKELPAPKEKIVAAVYKFRDQTGQYKPSDVGASWSTAVTQGATSILLRSMEESGWFLPVEREGLSNLFNERKIIRSSRSAFSKEKDKTNQLLPPLLFAGIILEGGIISFDSNVLTGGAGARYFGAGVSTQYREDRVTIYLRAVSTSNGRILKTVYTSKTILSQKVDVGLFRFVSLKRLLEAETGFTYNEPSEMAVKEAIEKAVYSLIIEGVMEGLWMLKDEDGLKGQVFTQYQSEKEENKHIGVHGDKYEPRRSKIALSMHSGGYLYNGDINGAIISPGIGVGLEYHANNPISLFVNTSFGTLGTENTYQGNYSISQAGVKYKFFNQLKFTPFVHVSLVALYEWSNNLESQSSGRLLPGVATSVGVEQLVNDKLGFRLGLSYGQLFTDKLDGVVQGEFKDAYWSGNLGLAFYLSR